MGEEGEGGPTGAEEEAPGEVTQINDGEIGATLNLGVREDKISANSSKNGSQDTNPNLVKTDSLDTRVGQKGERDRRKVPRHRRFWESPDCSCSKEVLEEGDWEEGERPREGSAGEIRIWLEDVQGVTKEELRSTPALSKYLLSRKGNDETYELASQTEDFTKVEFTVGTGTTCVDRRLEVAVTTFLESEKSRLTLRVFIEPKFNSKEGGEPLWVTIVAVVQLVNLVQAEPLWRWFPETRLTRAKDHYGAAVSLFKLSRWLDAFHLFQAAHRLALLAIGVKEKEDNKLKAGHQKSLEDHTSSQLRSSSGDRTLAAASLAEAWKLRTACCNNLAACHFQWGNHASVVQLSTVVLQVDSNQVKALYRRGVSYLEMKEFDFAERDLVAAHKVEPSNRAVSEALGQVKLRKKREQACMQAKMSKMFS